MWNFGRKVIGAALALGVLGVAALGAEARFLSFADELRRARAAIGPDAECRVLVEEIYARCELRTAGTHSIQVQFADIAGNMLPRKSVTLTRGTVEPAQFTGILAAYGLPTEVMVRCLSAQGVQTGASTRGYEFYVGDFNVKCDRDVVTLAYARAF
jgi:hypothetical protein